MRKSMVAAGIGLVSMLMFLGQAPALAAAPEKVEICHIPPDTPDNVQSILVGPAAVAAHITDHGDFVVGEQCSEGIGECEVFDVTVCVAGEDNCPAEALFPPPEAPEVHCADGRDNDCDGEVDECEPGQVCNSDGQCEGDACPCTEIWEGAEEFYRALYNQDPVYENNCDPVVAISFLPFNDAPDCPNIILSSGNIPEGLPCRGRVFEPGDNTCQSEIYFQERDIETPEQEQACYERLLDFCNGNNH